MREVPVQAEDLNLLGYGDSIIVSVAVVNYVPPSRRSVGGNGLITLAVFRFLGVPLGTRACNGASFTAMSYRFEMVFQWFHRGIRRCKFMMEAMVGT